MKPMITIVILALAAVAVGGLVAHSQERPAVVEPIHEWRDWPGYAGWRVSRLVWSNTGSISPPYSRVSVQDARYPDWPRASGYDLQDADNVLVSARVEMTIRGDLDLDGHVTTTDLSIVKEHLGLGAPDPNGYQ